jgi:hypothetical protein
LNRALKLFHLELASLLRKVRYDLAREIVVAICSLVIFALFLYVFNDFLNGEVAQVSQAMRNKLGEIGATTVFLTSGVLLYRALVRMDREDDAIGKFASSMGEAPNAISQYTFVTVTMRILASFVPSILLADRFLIQFSPTHGMATGFLAALAVGIWWARRGKFGGKPSENNPANSLLAGASASRLRILAKWRIGQIVQRNPAAKICLLAAAILALPPAIIAARNLPYFVAVLAAYAVGIFVASATAFQAAEDTQYSWLDQSAGVSHEEYVTAIKRVALSLAVPLGAIILAAWLFGGIAKVGTPFFLDGLKLSVIAVIPPWMMPYVIFQVDAKRPFIQITVVILLGLFGLESFYSQYLPTMPTAPSLGIFIEHRWTFFNELKHCRSRKAHQEILRGLLPWSNNPQPGSWKNNCSPGSKRRRKVDAVSTSIGQFGSHGW